MYSAGLRHLHVHPGSHPSAALLLNPKPVRDWLLSLQEEGAQCLQGGCPQEQEGREGAGGDSQGEGQVGLGWLTA